MLTQRFRSVAIILGFVALLFMLLPEEAWGRGRGGGGFRTSSSRGGWSSHSAPSSSTTTRGGSTFTNWGSRSSTSTSRHVTSVPKPTGATEADRRAFQRTRSANTFNTSNTFGNPAEARKAAAEDFKQQYGTQYKSTFPSRPATRPDHIPESVTVNGQRRDVEWREENGRGGYYYPGPSPGTWVLYDLASDRHNRSRYMYRHGYDPTGRGYVRSGVSFEAILMWIGVLILVGFLAYAAFTYWRMRQPPKKTAGPVKKHRLPPKQPKPVKKPTLDEQKVSHWDAIKPGDFINLKDQQTLEMLMESGKRFDRGVDLQVHSVREITELRNLMKWFVCELEPIKIKGEESIWYFVIKAVDDVFDLKVMFIPEDFLPGTRRELIETESNWIFQAPADPENYSLEELEYTDVIDQTLDDGSRVAYRRKGQGILYGAATDKPDGGPHPQFTTVVEYRADRDCENPELLLLEVGGVTLPDYTGVRSDREAWARERRAQALSSGTGVVWLFQGTNVSTNDVDLIGS